MCVDDVFISPIKYGDNQLLPKVVRSRAKTSFLSREAPFFARLYMRKCCPVVIKQPTLLLVATTCVSWEDSDWCSPNPAGRKRFRSKLFKMDAQYCWLESQPCSCRAGLSKNSTGREKKEILSTTSASFKMSSSQCLVELSENGAAVAPPLRKWDRRVRFNFQGVT